MPSHTFTGRAGAFRSDLSVATPPPPEADPDVRGALETIAASRVHDLQAAPIDTLAGFAALAVRLGWAEQRAGRRDRSGIPLMRLFSVTWTEAHERALRAAYRLGRIHAELA